MPYAINPKVTIADVEYTDKAVNGVSLTSGRLIVDEQPRAGYATISLVTPNNTYPNIEINQQVVVSVDDSNGTEVILWTGWVSDIQSSLNSFGSQGWLNNQSITAIGTLSKLNRRLVGAGGYPKEFDGDRIYDIVFEGAGITWGDYTPATDTWADVDSLLQWANVDLLIGEIDTPGDFELTDYNSGASSALTLAQQAASSGQGVLYECHCGRIQYDSYSSRTNDVATNGFTAIEPEAILSTGLFSLSRLSDLANQIEVGYKNNQTESDTASDSISTYGLYAARVDTILEHDYDAAQRVEYYLETRAFPRRSLGAILWLYT